MSATSEIIWSLFIKITVAAISFGKEITTNDHFRECREKYSLKNPPCVNSQADPEMKRCSYKDNVRFYCASSSPISVVIGTNQYRNISLETLRITSTASSKKENNSYCIEVAVEGPADYFLQCHTNSTNKPNNKWGRFNPNSRHPGNSVHSLPYIDVKRMDPEEFCKSLGPILFEKVPDLLACDSWHMCAIVLAYRYKNQSRRNVTLVDLSAALTKINFNCPSVRSLFSTLHGQRRRKFSKPGLLVFQNQQYDEFLFPYYPLIHPYGNVKFYDETLVTFRIQNSPGLETMTIQCQSSVLHNCGFDIVTNNIQIKSSSGDCHQHSINIEPSPGQNSTITCRAFNEFHGTWDSKTAYFEKNNTKISSGNRTSENSSHAPNKTDTRDEDKPYETPEPIKISTPAGTRVNTSSVIRPTEIPPHNHVASDVLVIVGALIGGIFLCFLILLPLLIYLYKRINLQQRRIRLTEEEIFEFMEGMQNEKAKSKGIHNVFVLPYDRSLEVSKIAVDFKTTILGSGAFGKVLKGTYKGQDVAIKTIDGTTLNTDAFRSLLSELKIMSYLGKHEHVMELVGAITSDIKAGEVFLILEYCAHGSAISYIREHREDFVSFLSEDQATYIQTSSVTVNGSGSKLNSKHLVRWSYEVACGMEYVSSRNIYHGDLAARNILLTESLTVKVGDFGLSRQLDVEKYSCYVQKKECPLPLKWMAIESLRDLKFSIQSDVWSFGVTLWEFFSLGTIPYPGMEWNLGCWKSLCEGVRLDRPDFASLRIYNEIIRKCWNEDPKDRPTFSTLKSLLQTEMEVI